MHGSFLLFWYLLYNKSMTSEQCIFSRYPRRNLINSDGNSVSAVGFAGKTANTILNSLTVEPYKPDENMTQRERLDYHDAVHGRIVASAGRSVLSLAAGFTLLGLHERLPEAAQTPATLTGVGIIFGAFIRGEQSFTRIVNDYDASRLKSDVRTPHAWLTLPFSKSAYLHFRNRRLKVEAPPRKFI